MKEKLLRGLPLVLVAVDFAALWVAATQPNVINLDNLKAYLALVMRQAMDDRSFDFIFDFLQLLSDKHFDFIADQVSHNLLEQLCQYQMRLFSDLDASVVPQSMLLFTCISATFFAFTFDIPRQVPISARHLRTWCVELDFLTYA